MPSAAARTFASSTVPPQTFHEFPAERRGERQRVRAADDDDLPIRLSQTIRNGDVHCGEARFGNRSR